MNVAARDQKIYKFGNYLTESKVLAILYYGINSTNRFCLLQRVIRTTTQMGNNTVAL